MARQVLPVVGAIIGGYFGGAAGAQWGWAIGSVIGNAIDPVVIKGPSIGDIAQQTSQEGVPRPIVFALSQPIAGNIVACGQPVIVKKSKRQGKGGPKVESQYVYRTYAIAVCEGPITAFMRVWRNGSLVYDARPGGQGSNNSKFLRNARFFLGTFDQMPSPDLEAKFGAGNVPAMRGTAYMVMADEDLTELQGAVPQYVFQVMRCEGALYTSRPYAVEVQDAVTVDAALYRAQLLPQPSINEDKLSPSIELLTINRFGGEVNYATPNEDKLSSSIELLTINRFGGEVNYAASPEDHVQVNLELLTINRFGSAVSYQIPPEDFVITSIELLSITRSVP